MTTTNRLNFVVFYACITTLLSCKHIPEETPIEQFHTIGNLTYLRSSEITNNTNPVVVYRHYQMDFEHNNLTKWEVVFDNGSRTQVLANEGEAFFAKRQHDGLYASWNKEQEELWGGPQPTSGHITLDPRYTQYLRNLHAKYDRSPIDKSTKVNESSSQSPGASQLKTYIQNRFNWNNSEWRVLSDEFVGTKTSAIGIGEAILARRPYERRAAHIQNIDEMMWEGAVPDGDWESDSRYPTYLNNLGSSGAIVDMPPQRKPTEEEDE